MPRIHFVNHAFAQLTATVPSARTYAYNALAYYQKGYKYDPRFKRRLWDGKVRLLREDGTFPAGLAPWLAETLTRKGWPTEIPPWPRRRTDGLTVMGMEWRGNEPTVTLRPYQQEAVAAAIAAQRGIVKMKTGTGKTVVLGELIKSLTMPTLVIVHQKELLYQTAQRLAAHLDIAICEVGLVGDGNHSFAPLTVALFQSLARDLDLLQEELDEFGVIICDEAHHVPSRTFSAVLEACTNAPYRYGFSATPDTEDGRMIVLEGMTGPLCFDYTEEEAVEDGVLVQPHVWMLQLPAGSDPAEVKDGDTDWTPLYDKGIARNDARNAAFAEAAACAATDWGATLVTVNKVAHGEDLCARIAAYGVATAFIHGSLSSAQRQRKLDDLATGAVQCLVATGIVDEGVDVPVISAVVLAGGGRAEHKTVQRIGRGRRPGGQAKLLVVDAWDSFNVVLAFHAQKRHDLYLREGWTVEDVTL